LHQTEKVFFSLDASIFETTKETYEDKYEFILPEITFDTNLFNNDKFGSLDLQSNLKVRSYETNKLENFLINDFDWESKEFNFNSGVNSKFLANLKNINYEAKNISKFKEKTTNEFFGSLGILTDINLEKISDNAKHSLTPKMLLRLSPGSMRKKENGSRLTPLSAFNINRSENINDYETGISGTLGFDYKIIKEDSNFDLSIAQVINEKENNKIADKTSLNEKLSDLVGSSKYVVNKNIDIKYDFSVDQNYQDLNYNEIGTTLKYNALDFNFGFLQEKKHIGNQEYFKTKIDLKNKENGLFSFETKRNLITNSSEFYNLSYEYLNDCLRAGLVFRREFYNDSELEPENSLLFKITLMPFGNINSPTFSK
jgi:LPS-assembly protein